MTVYDDYRQAGITILNLKAELAEARAQSAEAERGRLQFRKAYRELRAQIAALAARHESALVEGAARLAERDEARAQIKHLTEALERRGELIFGQEGD
jgi:phage I-like protein